jgi:hypothetical protein
MPGYPLIRSLWMPARLLRFERAAERWEQRGALVRVPPLLDAWWPGLIPLDTPNEGAGAARRLVLGSRAFARLCREPRGIAARIARIRARS